MDPKIAKRTQDSLGKIIKKPPLTDKLLAKPPFRFLHDIMTSVVKTTGFMKGLFTDSEMNSENVKDKDSKMAFLQKAVDVVGAASGKSMSVKPAKIVAGHEPDKTNEFLQALAAAINSKVDNEECVNKVLGKGSKGGSSKTEDKKEEKEKSRDRSSDRRKEDKRSRDKDDREKSRDKDKDKDKEERHKDKDKDREERHKEKEDKHKDRDERHKDRESRHKSGRSRDDLVQGAITKSGMAVDISHPVRNHKSLHHPVMIPNEGEGNIRQSVNPGIYSGRDDTDSPDIKQSGEEYSDDMCGSDFDFDKPLQKQGRGLTEEELAEIEEERASQGSRSRIRPKGARQRRESASEIVANVSQSEESDVIMDADPDAEGSVKKRKSGTKSRLSNRNPEEPGVSPVKQDNSPSEEKKRRESVTKGPKTSTPKNSPGLNASAQGRKGSTTNTPSKNNLSSTSGATKTPVKVDKGSSLTPKRRDNVKGGQNKENDKIGSPLSSGLKKSRSKDKYESPLVKKKSDKKLLSRKPESKQKISGSEKMERDEVEQISLQQKDKKQKLSKNIEKTESENKKHKSKSQDWQEREEKKKKREDEKEKEKEKENDAPETMNGDSKTDGPPVRMQRPSSAKGSRRRMEGQDSSDEDVPPARQLEPSVGEEDLSPQVAASKRSARPSSARPAPPKRKDDIIQNEPAMRLGTGQPKNLIIDDGAGSDDDDETFVVEESVPAMVDPEPTTVKQEEEDDEDHGGLVKKIMETKKEYEQPRKTDIERPTISDAQRRKQREAVQREIDKLRTSIQTLTRSANPLGKIMDYVQEDLDSMQKELEKWKAENKEHTLALKREKAVTERAVEPLKAQLKDVDQAINDQLDLIGAVKSNIMKNDQRIDKMLRTIAKS